MELIRNGGDNPEFNEQVDDEEITEEFEVVKFVENVPVEIGSKEECISGSYY